MTKSEAQRLIREVSPQFLADNPPRPFITLKKEAATELSAAEVAVNGEPLENVRPCPRCNTYDIDGDMTICPSCEDEIAEENPDGQWVNTSHGWLYE